MALLQRHQGIVPHKIFHTCTGSNEFWQSRSQQKIIPSKTHQYMFTYLRQYLFLRFGGLIFRFELLCTCFLSRTFFSFCNEKGTFPAAIDFIWTVPGNGEEISAGWIRTLANKELICDVHIDFHENPCHLKIQFPVSFKCRFLKSEYRCYSMESIVNNIA